MKSWAVVKLKKLVKFINALRDNKENIASKPRMERVNAQASLLIGLKTYQKKRGKKTIQVHEFEEEKPIPFKATDNLKKIGEEWMREHCKSVPADQVPNPPFPVVPENKVEVEL